MKRTNLLIFFWLYLFSASLLAQTSPNEIANWRPFVPQDEEYSIELPKAAFLVYEDKKELNQRFSVKFNGRFFFIFSENIKTLVPEETIQNFIKMSGAQPNEIKVGVFDGKKYSFKFSDGYFHNLWLIKTKNKIYAFHSASEIENDEIVDKFFKSLKFNRVLLRTKAQSALVKIKAEVDRNNVRFNAFSDSNKYLSAENSDIGANLPTQTDLQDSPMKIISKPRANYTDFARFFDIQGSVRLRVMFLSTGKIGSIETIKKLPFGLTETSIEAARNMRFEPMKKDGTAINVARLVEYSFSIY